MLNQAIGDRLYTLLQERGVTAYKHAAIDGTISSVALYYRLQYLAYIYLYDDHCRMLINMDPPIEVFYSNPDFFEIIERRVDQETKKIRESE